MLMITARNVVSAVIDAMQITVRSAREVTKLTMAIVRSVVRTAPTAPLTSAWNASRTPLRPQMVLDCALKSAQRVPLGGSLGTDSCNCVNHAPKAVKLVIYRCA